MAQANTGKALGVAMSRPTLQGLSVGGTSANVETINLGLVAGDLVAFHGKAGVAQAGAITTIASGTAATTATYGIPTPDIATLFTTVNSILTVLRNKGLIA